MTKENKKILVTGCAGFIGFHSALALHKRGDFVLGLDNFNAYYPPALKRERARQLSAEGIHCFDIDITDSSSLATLFEKHAFTHVLHLAAQAGVRYAKTNPEAYQKSNLEGFLSILEVCKTHPHLKLIFASSSSIYGANTKIPFSESDITDHPISLYAATKKANELMAYSYHHLYGLSATALRFFTVYGPWGRPDMAYYAFAEAILQKKPIHLFNNGKMQRDFTYIDDIVAGILAALDLGAPWEVFNLGNNSPIELMYFVELIEQGLGIKAEKRFIKADADEVQTTFADISHAQKRLGYSPKTCIEKGIPQFLNWLEAYRASEISRTWGSNNELLLSPHVFQK